MDTKCMHYTNIWELCIFSTLLCLKAIFFCPFLIICSFVITGLGSRIPFSECLLFFTRTKSLTSSLFKAVSYVLVQHYSTDLLLKWNTAVTFLIPLTFYNLWNLAQQQEFNHSRWCKRQNKAPLRSDRDMTSKVQSLQTLTGDPQGQLQWSRLWSSCNLWLCLLITLAEILHLHGMLEYFAVWTLLFSCQRIISYLFYLPIPVYVRFTTVPKCEVRRSLILSLLRGPRLWFHSCPFISAMVCNFSHKAT